MGGTTGSSCCEVHDGAGCDDEICEDFVCGNRTNNIGDSFCCTGWWNSYCVNAAAGRGPMYVRDRFWKPNDRSERRNSEAGSCSVCQSLPPPPSPGRPPTAPNVRPLVTQLLDFRDVKIGAVPSTVTSPLLVDGVKKGASLCFTFESYEERNRALEGRSFETGVASALGIWPGRLTQFQPRAEDGCACGSKCVYQGCLADFSVASANLSLSHGPSAVADIVQFADMDEFRWPGRNLAEVCDELQDRNKSLAVDVCFGCRGMGARTMGQLANRTGFRLTHGDLRINEPHTTLNHTLSAGWDQICLALIWYLPLVAFTVHWIRKRHVKEVTFTSCRPRVFWKDWKKASDFKESREVDAARDLKSEWKHLFEKIERASSLYIVSEHQMDVELQLQVEPWIHAVRTQIYMMIGLSLLTLPTGFFFFVLWTCAKFVRDDMRRSIHEAFTLSKLEEHTRPKLVVLIVASVFCVLIMAVPMTFFSRDAVAQGSSLYQSMLFELWNKWFNEGKCVMLSMYHGPNQLLETRPSQSFVIGTTEEIELCLHVFRVCSLASGVQAVLSLVLAILAANTLNIIGCKDKRYTFCGCAVQPLEVDLPRTVSMLHAMALLESTKSKKASPTPAFRRAGLVGLAAVRLKQSAADDTTPESRTNTLTRPAGCLRVFCALGALLGFILPVLIAVFFLARYDILASGRLGPVMFNGICIAVWVLMLPISVWSTYTFGSLPVWWTSAYGISYILHGNTQPKMRMSKFGAKMMLVADPNAAAQGLEKMLGMTSDQLKQEKLKGWQGIVDEVKASGTKEDRECLDYVLHQHAGSSGLIFPNSAYPRDCDANGVRADRKREDGLGMTLDDFCEHPDSVAAGLLKAHVLALRLYSTKFYDSFNRPLRESAELPLKEYPFPITLAILMEAVLKLRVGPQDGASANTTPPGAHAGRRSSCRPGQWDVARERVQANLLGQQSQAQGSTLPEQEAAEPVQRRLGRRLSQLASRARGMTWSEPKTGKSVKQPRSVKQQPRSPKPPGDFLELYRGLTDVDVDPDFLERGGTHLGPLSTSKEIKVAHEYAGKGTQQATILIFQTNDVMERGADIQYLSCFPAEREYLYPPLTKLKPVDNQTLVNGGTTFRMIKVRPYFGNTS